MFAVDNVEAHLRTAQGRADKRVTEQYITMSQQECRQRAFPVYTVEGYKTKYGGKLNHLGRYCWTALVGPVPRHCEVVDCLPPGLVSITWGSPDDRGETMIWMHFKAPVHHSTVRKNLRGLEIVYIRGCDLPAVSAALSCNGPNKYVSS